jgi:hypothetical protein
MNEANQATGQAKRAVRILLVLHNALHRPAPLNAAIGDIVLTDQALCFIRYHDFPYAGSLAGGAGFLIGGVPGAMAASLGGKNDLAAARNVANACRSKLYGFRLGERVKRHSLSFVCPPAAMAKLEASSESELSLTLRDGKRFNFAVPPISAEVRDVINSWPSSRSLYDASSDPEGFFLGGASPRELLRRIVSGDSNAAAEVYRLGLREKYAITLYSELQVIAITERQAILAAFANAPEVFRQSLAAVARKELLRGIGEAFGVSILALLLGGILGWIAISERSIFAGLLAPCAVAFFGRVAILAVKRVQRARSVRRYLMRGNVSA